MIPPSHEGLDEALVPLGAHLAMLVPEVERVGVRVSELRVEMPIELDIVLAGGSWILGSSPPLHPVVTGFDTERHRMRVTIVTEENLLEPPEDAR